MSSLDQAEELEARAAALRAEHRLELENEEAVKAYLANPSEETKDAKQATAEALHNARAQRRSNGVQVGGDAFVDEEA
ncbi:hypothetical protein ACFOY2_05255 [Nonomuraea purpurea]|uniref:TraR/DksA family transcriptional regulator n=1 Tax=Nonomuraea purpurea TaxID=1849276 RepID=A0ABV8FXZ7_9ACTN